MSAPSKNQAKMKIIVFITCKVIEPIQTNDNVTVASDHDGVEGMTNAKMKKMQSTLTKTMRRII